MDTDKIRIIEHKPETINPDAVADVIAERMERLASGTVGALLYFADADGKPKVTPDMTDFMRSGWEGETDITGQHENNG